MVFLLAMVDVLLALIAGPQVAQAVAPVPMASFLGTWVGTQTWAIENPPPNARGDQLVELTIEMVDGNLVGFINPWFGGEDGATLANVRVVGEELHASGSVGKPREPTQRARRDWKSEVTIDLLFKLQPNDRLVGTAAVMLDQTQWTRFRYELKKRG